MTLGFIILRHVNNSITNLLWQECYSCIRNYYTTNKIIIIDDSSNKDYLTTKPLENTEIIQSEFPGRGELLPYYYFLKYAWFDTAVIVHDSVFIQKPIRFTMVNKFLWYIPFHVNDNIELETNYIKKLSNHTELLELYKSKSKWNGCFGGMTVISHDAISKIQSKYNFTELIKHIKCRLDRVAFERILGVILTLELRLITSENSSYFGSIWNYCPWNFNVGYTFNDYIKDKKSDNFNIPIAKLWSGR